MYYVQGLKGWGDVSKIKDTFSVDDENNIFIVP